MHADRMWFTVFDLSIRAMSASKSYRIMGRSALVSVSHPHSKVGHHKIPSRPRVFFVFWYFYRNEEKEMWKKIEENMIVKSNKEDDK